MQTTIFIALAGLVGTLCRYWLSGFVARQYGETFPWGTMAVNFDLKAREKGLAGATVLRGVMGFGKHSILHTAKILRLSEDLPMVIEIVDSAEKLNDFLP